MKLNENIWLSASNRGIWWQSQSVGAYLNDNPFYASIVGEYNGAPLGSLSNLYRKKHQRKYGQLIDNSFAYAAIPESSPLSYVNYVNKTSTEGGLYTTYHGDIPLGICAYTQELSATDGGANRGVNEVYHYLIQDRWGPWSQQALYNADYTSENVNVGGGGSTYVITDYNYNDIVLLVRVVAYDSTYTNRQIQDLDVWETDYKNDYPNITCVFCVPYLGKPGGRVSLDQKFTAVDMRTYDITLSNSRVGCLRNIELKLPPNYTALNNYHYQNVWNAPENANTLISYDAPNLRAVRGFTIGHYTPDTVYYTNTTIDDFSNNSDTWYRAGAGLRIAYGDPDLFNYRAPSNSLVFTTLKDTDNIRSLVSWYGLQFVADRTALQGEPGDVGFYIPVIDEIGFTTGEYLDGESAAELPNATWGEDFHEKNGYDGKSPPKWDYETKLNPNTLTKMHDTFTHVYLANYLGVRSIANWLYGTLATGATTDTFLEKFMNINPIDCIADIIMYPFQIMRGSGQISMIVGNQTAQLQNIYYLSHDIHLLDFGTIAYRKYYNDFRDFEPYSDCTLEIPYHGSVHLKPSVYAGHDISVKCLVDLLSGASLALVYRDGLVMDAIAGQIGMHLQLSGIQSANYNNALYAAANGYKQAAVGDIAKTGGALLSIAGNIGSGNFAGAVSSAFSGIMADMQSEISLNNAEYRLEHVQIPFKTRGTNSVLTSYGNEQCCRLIQTRPQMLESDLESFAHTHGYACCINGVVSDFNGFTKFSAIDLSGVDLSAAEKSELLRILQSGVYL
jgi:hypothetical protein